MRLRWWGGTVEKVEARGKWLLVHFSGDLILVTHMLMSGSWHLYRTGEKWWMGKEQDAGGRSVRQTGRRWRSMCRWRSSIRRGRSSGTTQIPKLGVDLLGGEYTREAGVARLRAYGAEHPEAEVAVVLLNQRVLAGLGNVYKSEVAFAAGVNPFRAMATVTDRELEVMAEVCGQVDEGECAGWGGGWHCDVLGQPADDGVK